MKQTIEILKITTAFQEANNTQTFINLTIKKIMFIKFSGKLVDVSNCYLENYEVKSYANYDKKDEHEITAYNVGLYPTESDFGQTQYILFESFTTKEEADQRFTELEAILCGQNNWEKTLIENIEWLTNILNQSIKNIESSFSNTAMYLRK